MSNQYPVDPSQPVPNPQAPVTYQQSLTKAEANLNTLSICWYVMAVLVALPSCLGLAYVVFGVIFGVLGAAAGSTSNDAGGAVAGAAFGGIFACIGGFLVVVLLSISYLFYRCGKNLATRGNITVCYVAAVLACLQIPLGLILAIFTFVVLGKPETKALFNRPR
jgi:hypothetical protein